MRSYLLGEVENIVGALGFSFFSSAAGAALFRLSAILSLAAVVA